jgi:hypothetical protein
MMKKPRRLAVALAVSGLVVAGAVAASQLAHANVAGTCTGYGPVAFCSVTETITAPTSISVALTAHPTVWGTYNYTLQCTLNGQTATTSGSDALLTPPTKSKNIDLPFPNPDSCTISVNGNIPGEVAGDRITVEVDYTTGSTSTGPPPPGTVALIRGYGGKCLDDKGNSSANRTKVIIWTCNSSDRSQAWTYTNGELVHNGKCANDQGGGGNGSKVILWTCNHSPNEVWFHAGRNGEFILSGTTHGLQCLTDPNHSTRNGTQLVVSACHNSSDQHWST